MSMKPAGQKVRTLYAGEKAEGAPVDGLRAAQEAVAAGAPPEEVWRQTGYMVAEDGARWEIDDSQARLLAYPEPGQSMTLREALDHPALFEAYPDLANALLVEMPNMREDQVAQWYPGVGAMLSRRNLERYRMDPLAVLLHEIQHGIQFREGWHPGAELRDSDYRSAPGEVEAYDTQERIGLDAGERRATPPARLRR